MVHEQKNKKMVSVIIPAHNEEERISAVIAPAISHPHVYEVIVIDDGSEDDTAAIAKQTGARVISLPENKGKAFAMNVGVSNATQPYICFLDADLIGFSSSHLTNIIKPVLQGTCDMYVGIRARKTYWLNRMLRFFPVLGGERCLTKALWHIIPHTYKNHFQIEIAMNYYTKKSGRHMKFDVLTGLSQVIKEKKWGFWYGMFRRLWMMWDVSFVSFKLYIIHAIFSKVTSLSSSVSSVHKNSTYKTP